VLSIICGGIFECFLPTFTRTTRCRNRPVALDRPGFSGYLFVFKPISPGHIT
jgi:hypothetical protein